MWRFLYNGTKNYFDRVVTNYAAAIMIFLLMIASQLESKAQEKQDEAEYQVTQDPVSYMIWPDFRTMIVQNHFVNDSTYSTFSMHAHTEVKVKEGYLVISETYEVDEQHDWGEVQKYLLSVFKEDVKLTLDGYIRSREKVIE